MRTRHVLVLLVLLLAACQPGQLPAQQATKAPPTKTPAVVTATAGATHTAQPVASPTAVATAIPGVAGDPYQGAPLCPGHDVHTFHTLWDRANGCHYDHEHGQDPFTAPVVAMFPGFNLYALLGNVGVGHTNLSSPMENDHKHGGFKWQVSLVPYVVEGELPCHGYEGERNGVNAAVIQWHNFGDYSIEMEARVHTAVLLARQCHESNPTDYGYVFINQFQDYGQRVTPYQGNILPYPNSPDPAYPSPRGAYFTVDCVAGFPPVGVCRTSLADILSRNRNTNSIWTSKAHDFIENSRLLQILFRIRNTYQVLDWADQSYPFTFKWLCSNDGGVTYAAIPGCRYNNSASGVHEVHGTIPAAWDNLAVFDTDTRVGRITADGYVTHFGDLNLACTAPGPDCHPLKLVSAFVGTWGTQLIDAKINQFSLAAQPSRDVWFCQGVPCVESAEGAQSSGWIGSQN